MVLSIVMALGISPVSAAEEEPPIGASGEIISFEALPEKTANQTMPLGTSLEELGLPVTLTAAVLVAAASDAEDPGQDSGEPGMQEPEQTNQSIPVTWVSDPDYGGNAAGVYTFTPETGSFTLANGVLPPQITVAVGIAAGEITAFAALSDDVRWQSVEYGTALENLNLPKMLSGTVEGGQAEVPVTWEAEPRYDGHAKGLYLLTAVPGEGFTASTELPVIAVVVRGEAPRFMTFSLGGGALDTDPFLIGSAEQLAAVAGIVNEGKLKTLFLGEGGSGQVYLKLENDLDLSGYTSGGGWMPIGKDAATPFNGSFDGGGHQITGLFISRSGPGPSASYQGLFGNIGSGGLVKDLGITDADITGGTYVGGAAGYINSGTVQNCYVTGSVSGGAGNDKNGAPKNIAELQAGTGFPAALTTAPWTYTPGKLPGLNGQAVDMPAHLLGATPFEGGGIDGDPYKISTAAQLTKLAELVNAGTSPYADADIYYRLENNLDLSGYTSDGGWTPIGIDANLFSGRFDGGGHQIAGLFISRSGADL